MNKKIDINKFNKSITFQNRGIGFTQIGVAGEILNLIDDLQQENKKLKDNWNKLKEYLNYQSERAVGEDEYVYDEIYNEMQELESSDNQ